MRPSRQGHAAFLAALLVASAPGPAVPDPSEPAPLARAGERRKPDPPLPEEVRATLALQISLEARGYSPGLIDGSLGGKTRTATAAFQAASGLSPTGDADRATLDLLRADPWAVLAEFTVTPKDLEEVDPPPKDWIERSKRDRLRYPSLSNLIAERVHTSERFLAALNPDADLAALRPGDVVVVPAVNRRRTSPPVERIEIDLERKVVLLFAPPRDAVKTGRRAAPAGLLFCSIAADPAKATPGETTIARVAADPTYTFDPAKWPEVRGVKKVLLIPPGPRSPVGIRWIGLDREGVGIHGSPEPEMIGKTGSHGCFRLTNWDAVWLAGLVHAGMPVRIVRTSAESSWPWPGK